MPSTSVFTSLYGHLSVCVYIALPGTINTTSRSRLNYGWDIYTDRSPRAPSFIFAAEKQNRAKERNRSRGNGREWFEEEEERDSKGGDTDWGTESKLENKLIDSRQRTQAWGRRKEVQCSVCVLMLPAALQRWTDMIWTHPLGCYSPSPCAADVLLCQACLQWLVKPISWSLYQPPSM